MLPSLTAKAHYGIGGKIKRPKMAQTKPKNPYAADLDQKIEAALISRFILVATTEVTTELVNADATGAWKQLEGYYESPMRASVMVTAVLNSCLTQRRRTFIITRNHIKALIKNDRNIANFQSRRKARGIRNEKYTLLYKTMMSMTEYFKPIKRVRVRGGHEVQVFEVVWAPAILFLGQVDPSAQMNEIENYFSKDIRPDKPKRMEKRASSAPSNGADAA